MRTIQLFDRVKLLDNANKTILRANHILVHITVPDGQGKFHQWTEAMDDGTSTTMAVVKLPNGKINMWPTNFICFGEPSIDSYTHYRNDTREGYKIDVPSSLRAYFRYGPNKQAERYLAKRWVEQSDISNYDLYNLDKYKDITK